MEERQSLSVQPHEIGDLEAVKMGQIGRENLKSNDMWQLSAETSVIPELLREIYKIYKYIL